MSFIVMEMGEPRLCLISLGRFGRKNPNVPAQMLGISH
jgi:hypothetical protein